MRPFLLHAITLMLLLGQCFPVLAAETSSGLSHPPLRIVVSFSILADLVHQVGGDRVEISTLVASGGDAHTFNPSPRDSVLLTRADLIVLNGLGFDDWMEDLISASETTAPALIAGKSIRPIMSESGHSHAPGHSHGSDSDSAPDPHYWHDPTNLPPVADAINRQLQILAPDSAAYFTARTTDLNRRVDTLDKWMRERVQAIPPKNRKLVTSHDSLTYMARRYGLKVITTALGSVSTEASEPNAARMATVIRTIRQERVPVVFFDTTHSTRLMERMAEEAGVRIAPPLYTDSLGKSDSTVTDTLSMLRFNMDIISRELSRTP